MFHFLFLFSQLWQILIILQTSFSTALWVSTYNWHYDVLLCHYQRQPQFCMQNPNIISVKKTQETEAHRDKCNILIIKGCLQEKKMQNLGLKHYSFLILPCWNIMFGFSWNTPCLPDFVSLGEEASAEWQLHLAWVSKALYKELTILNPTQTGPMFSGESKLCENNYTTAEFVVNRRQHYYHQQLIWHFQKVKGPLDMKS